MKRRWLPENVSPYTDRHGKVRYRYRKTGHKTHHFRNEPGTHEFMAELQAARKQSPVEKQQRFKPGTIDALIASYYNSPAFRDLEPITCSTYRGILERWRKGRGDLPVNQIRTHHIDAMMAKMSDRPGAANNLRKMLSRIFRHAIKLNWIEANPVNAADKYRKTGSGFHCWTEEEIAQYEARWPLGTRERVAMAMLLYTSLRRGDMVRVGRQNRRGAHLYLSHKKNSSETTIRIMPQLEEAIEACPSGHMPYLVTSFGKPFTAAGFGNWFREACNEAGLPHCSAHGLRKAMARRLAESNATNQQGRAVTGQKTDRMFTYYAEQANRRDLADTALVNLGEHLANLKTGSPK